MCFTVGYNQNTVNKTKIVIHLTTDTPRTITNVTILKTRYHETKWNVLDFGDFQWTPFKSPANFVILDIKPISQEQQAQNKNCKTVFAIEHKVTKITLIVVCCANKHLLL